MISTVAVSGSTSTIIACTPLAVLPRSGPKYAVLSSPGSVPGRTAPRSGLALPDSSPSEIPRCCVVSHRTRGRRRARADRAGTPSTELARFSTFSRTAIAAAWHALPGDDRAAAREGPGAPVKFARVARDDPHVFDIDAEHVGDELREHREVPLPLRADAGRAAHLAARLDRDARTFVRADAGAFDVTRDADADVPPFGAQPRLLVANELLVADDLGRLLERRQVVAAVVNERRGILKHDLVIHRKLVRSDQVALANLDAIDAKLARGEIEQPLADEHAVLPAGASHRRHDRLVGEDRGELALVVRDVVRARAACIGC